MNIKKLTDYIEITLTSGRVCKIDLVDEWITKEFELYSTKGHVSARKYIETEWGMAYLNVYLHKIITKTCKKSRFKIDHINRDGHDNRRANLRFATTSQNCANSAAKKNAACEMKGVCERKNHSTNKFGAFLNHGQNSNNLGYFKNKDMAARVYDVNALAIHKEFAFLNFPNLRDKYAEVIKKHFLSHERVLFFCRDGFKIKTSFERYQSRLAPVIDLGWSELDYE